MAFVLLISINLAELQFLQVSDQYTAPVFSSVENFETMEGEILEDAQQKLVNLTLFTSDEETEILTWNIIEDADADELKEIAKDSKNPDAAAWD